VLMAPSDLDGAQPFIAITVDGWSDFVPLREKRGADTNAPIDNRHPSGLAVNAASPNSRPPQALLLARRPHRNA